MSARYDIAATVLDTAVRYYMPPSEIAELINNIFNSNLGLSVFLSISDQSSGTRGPI